MSYEWAVPHPMSPFVGKKTGKESSKLLPISTPGLAEKRRNQEKYVLPVAKDKLVREVFCPSLIKGKDRCIL